MHIEITSTANSKIKDLVHLQEKSRNRRRENLFVVEGLREINLALEAGYNLEKLFYCPDLISATDLDFLENRSSEIIAVSKKIYQKIAYRGSTEGFLAVGKQKSHALENISFKTDNPLILVAEAPEKPGNIGALLRTADAAGLDAVLIANPRTDLYNPNIIRSSVGCIFTNQVATGSSAEIISFLKDKNIPIYCAALQASETYTKLDYKKASALVMGTEADGLQSIWLENSTQNIIIPMSGKIDSMNVSVSAGILVFEAKRQRGFQK